MEGLKEKAIKSAVSKPVLWFCLGALLTAVILIALGIPLADSYSRRISGEITEELISKCGAVALKAEEKGIPLPGELLALSWAEKPDEAAFQRGLELMSPYGYKPGMNERLNPYYFGIRNETTAVIIGFAGIILLILFLAGLTLICTMTRQISGLTRSAEQILENKDARYPEGLSGCIGRHTMLLKQYAARTERLLSALQEEKSRMKNFLSDISHQIKTPAAVLKLNHELLLDDPDMPSADRADFLRRDLVQLERMEWLLSGLLKLARMDAGTVEYDCAPHSMQETAETVFSSFRQSAAKKGVALINRIPGNMVFSYDENWMQEALGNLIKNALEHCRELDGEIVCGGSVTPMTAELYISDNGNGIPDGELPHIFERFYSKSADVNPSGTGIGLPLAAKIFDAFGGKISASSSEGTGTCFKVSFLTKM